MSIDLPKDRRNSRLSLVHLLLWIAVAALLAVNISVPFSSQVLLDLAINSAAITAALVAMYQATRDGEWVDAHPGHWCAMVVLWLYVDRWLVTPQLTELAPRHAEMVSAVFFIGTSLLFVLGMLVGDWGRAWKLAFAVHAAAFAAAATWRAVQSWGWQGTAELVRDTLAPPVDVVAVVLVVFAVLHDFWWKDLRDWKHWVGLVWFAFHWATIVQTYVVPYLSR